MVIKKIKTNLQDRLIWKYHKILKVWNVSSSYPWGHDPSIHHPFHLSSTSPWSHTSLRHALSSSAAPRLHRDRWDCCPSSKSLLGQDRICSERSRGHGFPLRALPVTAVRRIPALAVHRPLAWTGWCDGALQGSTPLAEPQIVCLVCYLSS